jgi:competence protein ComEC
MDTSGAPVSPWWALALVAGWLLGLALQLQQPVLADRTGLHLLLASGFAGASLWALWGAPRRRMRASARWPELLQLQAKPWPLHAARLGLAALSAALLGFASTAWRAEQRLQESLPPVADGVDLVVEGRLASLPQRLPQGWRWAFEVERASLLGGEPLQLPSRVALAWLQEAPGLQGEAGPAARSAWDGVPRAGERWRFTVRLRPPHGLMNPHGFDAELWWFEQGLRATGSVRVRAGLPPPQRLQPAAALSWAAWRQRLRDDISANVASPRLAGVVAALVIGDQQAVARDDWAVYRTTGVAHLLAISGLHVTLFAWVFGRAVKGAWRRWPAASLRCPAPTAGRLAGCLAAAGYAALAGWGVPAQRTVWMLTVAALLPLLGLRWPWPWVLGLAAAVVTVADPWALMQPGFWLSFGAVALLMAAEAAREDPPAAIAGSARARSPASGAAMRLGRALRELARTQWVISLGLAPLTLVLFQQVSLVGFVANLLAVPWVTLLVTPVALAGALWAPCWTLAAWLLQAMNGVLGVLAAWPAAAWSAPAAPAWAQALGLLAGLLLVLPWPWKLRALALPLALPLLWPQVPAPPHGRFELQVLDVGQGSAVLVRTRHHRLVYDAGPRVGLHSDAGQRVLLPLLRGEGVGRLDALVLSHGDSDHIGGAATLLEAMAVGALWSSLPAGHELLALAQSRGAPPRGCTAGSAWTWDGVHLAFLYPSAALLQAEAAPPARGSANRMSCVLVLTDAHGSQALLTGDIPAAVEEELLRSQGHRLASDMLLLAHHGSRSSSSAAWLDTVHPRWAVAQVGWRNPHRHPAADVVQRLQARGIALVRSDHCGAWRWRSGAGEGQCEREHRLRYWHHRPAGPAPNPPPDRDPSADLDPLAEAGATELRPWDPVP